MARSGDLPQPPKKTASEQGAASLTGGDIVDVNLSSTRLSEKQMEETLSGFSQGPSGGAAVGLALTTALGTQLSTLEIGLFTPQVSINLLSYSFMIRDANPKDDLSPRMAK